MTQRALVIGKFLPPHDGHSEVIEHARALQGGVDVIVCDLAGQRPAAPERARWIASIHPDVRVEIAPDICGWHAGQSCPPRCSTAWADHLRRLGFGPWRAVVGSETYIEPFAAALGAEAVLVDLDRRRHPVSGTAVRQDLPGAWQHLHPAVRAGLTRRIVIVGAESTGTTTLARDLAAEVHGPWVPEYGREYSEQRAVERGSIWNVTWKSGDFDVIADRQSILEEEVIQAWSRGPAAGPGPLGPLAVCDTDVLATAIWHRRYCGTDHPHLVERARAHPPFLYALTTPQGVPFEQDGLRDGEHLRDEMTSWFRGALARQPVPWIEVEGGRDERPAKVMQFAVQEIANQPLFNSPGD